MAAIFNMGGSLLRLYLFSVLVLLTTNGIAQKSGKTMKSTYKIISDEFYYALPDTMFKKLGIDTGTLRVPLGNMYYTNYFKVGKVVLRLILYLNQVLEYEEALLVIFYLITKILPFSNTAMIPWCGLTEPFFQNL